MEMYLNRILGCSLDSLRLSVTFAIKKIYKLTFSKTPYCCGGLIHTPLQ